MLLASGCSGGFAVEFEPEGGEYTEADLEALLEEADISGVADIATADSPQTRDEVLVDLRTKGEDAASVASLLTQGFPQPSYAVPVSVEGAVLDDEDVWIVVEAWGEEGGMLEFRRAWVFSRDDGDVLWSGAKR
jgi:hypothetical protein